MKILQIHKGIAAWKQLTSGSVNRKIFGAALAVGLLTVSVKVAAVAKELVVAWRFGTGDALDAFFIALMVPAFGINVLAGSFNSALIPTYIQVQEREGKKAAHELFSGALVWGMSFLAIAVVIMVATSPLYLPKIASGFAPQKLDLSFWLLCSLAPLVVLSGAIISWSAVLNAGERFVLAAFSPIISPLFTILLIFLVPSGGIFNLSIGLVGGGILELTLLGIALHRQGVSLNWQSFGLSPYLRQVIEQYFPAVVGSLLMCSAVIVDQAMAATLPSGSVSALNYGYKMISLPLTLSTTTISTVVIPYFSKMVATEDWQGLRHTLKYNMLLIFAVSIPLTIVLIICSQPIIQILLQRGSFTAEDTARVAEVQSFFALQIPFYLGCELLVRLTSSIRKNSLLMWVSVFNLIMNITLNYIFMQWIGLKGIALSTSCVYLFSFSYLLFFSLKNMNKLAKNNL